MAGISVAEATTTINKQYTQATIDPGDISRLRITLANGASTAATLNVLNPAVLTEDFSPNTVKAGQTSTLTVTLTNPNAQDLTAAVLTNTLPGGVAIANPTNATTTCSGGSVAAAVGGNSLTLTGATVPANGSCQARADVVSNASGAYTNSNSANTLTTAKGATNASSAQATLTVLQAPTVATSFGTGVINVGGTSLLTITLSNPNASDINLSSTLVDTLPGGLAVATPNSLGGTCSTGSVGAVAGSNSISYASGAKIPAGGCTRTANVTSDLGGSYTHRIAIGASRPTW